MGYINRWTMEITNNSQHYSIPLVVGRRIAQIVFFHCEVCLLSPCSAFRCSLCLHTNVRSLLTLCSRCLDHPTRLTASINQVMIPRSSQSSGVQMPCCQKCTAIGKCVQLRPRVALLHQMHRECMMCENIKKNIVSLQLALERSDFHS